MRYHNVGRFEVAVDHGRSDVVQVVHAACHVQRHSHSGKRGHLALCVIDVVCEISPCHELHHNGERTEHQSTQLHNVPVVQPAECNITSY